MRCSIVVRIVVAQVNVMLRTLNRRGDPRDAAREDGAWTVVQRTPPFRN